jgi:hypothetical protein
MKKLRIVLVPFVIALSFLHTKMGFALRQPLPRYDVSICAEYNDDGSALYGASCSTLVQDGPCYKPSGCNYDRVL